MRKIAVAIMMMVAMMFMVNVSYSHAQGDFLSSVWIDGYVTNPEGRGIGGANLVFKFIDGDKIVSTNASGYFGFLYNRNFCDVKWVWISATGYITIRRGVSDGSCCDCYDNCDPANPYTTCANHLPFNFTLNGPDSDDDSYYDVEDNCPAKPNGRDKGTCINGNNIGDVCYTHSTCGGCLAFCSLNQEDSDHDGIGDACEGGFMQASVASTQSIAVKNNVLNLFALWLPMYCAAQGGCDYECLGQAIEDFLDGRDNFMGRPITPEPKPLTYECPEFMNFQELVNLLLDNLFDFFHGDNFPPEE